MGRRLCRRYGGGRGGSVDREGREGGQSKDIWAPIQKKILLFKISIQTAFVTEDVIPIVPASKYWA